MQKIVAGGLCLLTAASGFILGSATSSGTPPVLPVAAQDPGMAPALQSLQAELVELKRSFIELQMSLRSRSNVDATASSGDRLDDAIRQLQQLAARIPPGPAEAATSWVAPSNGTAGYRSRSEFDSGMARRLSELDLGTTDGAIISERLQAATEQLGKEHQMWSIQQLLSCYGPPDEVRPSDAGLILQYNLPIEVGREQEHVRFRIQEGYVVRTNLEVDR